MSLSLILRLSGSWEAERTWTSHQDYRSSHRKVYGQPGSARAPPVAYADGEGRGQGLLPWCSNFPQRPLWTCGGRIRWASQKHWRRHRLCDTSCPSAPAQQLLRVAPGLRRLSSPWNLHLPFSPLSLLGLSSREGVHAQPDATPLRSARAPDPR